MTSDIVQRGAGAIAPAAERDVMDLLARAVEAGASVEALERLVALKERVDRERARRAFFEALAAAQEEMPEVPKARTAQIATRSGVSYSYRYAALEDITRVVRPVLARHGLSYAWDVAQGDGTLIVTCVLRHVDGHEERASFPVPVDSGARMSAAQANGAALTYGRRQSLVAVLGLTTADEDIDGAGDVMESNRITPQQAADLDALIDEVGADRQRFLAWAGVERIEDLPADRYATAVRMLERRRGAIGRGWARP